jgi:hypothetical protein
MDLKTFSTTVIAALTVLAAAGCTQGSAAGTALGGPAGGGLGGTSSASERKAASDCGGLSGSDRQRCLEQKPGGMSGTGAY